MNQSRKIIVIKYGSKCVVNDRGLDLNKINDYTEKIIRLKETHDVVIVASGSVAVGKRRCQAAGKSIEKISSRALASLGSAEAAAAWQHSFAAHQVLASQVLVTHREIDSQEEGPSLLQAITESLAAGIVPVINENDILSQAELKKLSYGGDNDGLAAHIAIRLQAESLLLLTSVEGFLIDGIVQRELKTAAIESVSRHFEEAGSEGTGSIQSKLIAAGEAAAVGVRAFIGHAEADYTQILSAQTGTEVL